MTSLPALSDRFKTILWPLPFLPLPSLSLWCPVTSLLVGAEAVVEFFLATPWTHSRSLSMSHSLCTSSYEHLPPKVTNLCRHPSLSLPYGEHHPMSGSPTSTEHHKRHWNREGSYQVCGSRFYKISLLEFSNESNFKLQYPTNNSNKSQLLSSWGEWMLNGWVSISDGNLFKNRPRASTSEYKQPPINLRLFQTL